MAASNMAASGLFGLKVAGLSFRHKHGPRSLVVRAAAEEQPEAAATSTEEQPKAAEAKAPAAKPPPIGPKRGAKVT